MSGEVPSGRLPGMKGGLLCPSLLYCVLVCAVSESIIVPLLAPALTAPEGSSLMPGASMELRQLLYGVILSAYPAMMFVTAPLAGHLSDSRGRRRMLLACLLILAASNALGLLSFVMPCVSLLLLSRFAGGLASSGESIAQAGLADYAKPEWKSFALSASMFVAASGFLLGAALVGLVSASGLLPEAGGWLSLGLGALGGALAIPLIMRTMPQDKPCGDGDGSASWLAGVLEGFAMLRLAFKDDVYRSLAALLLLQQTAETAYLAYCPVFLMEGCGFPPSSIAWYLTALGLFGAIAFLFLLSPLKRLMGATWLLRSGLALSALSIALTLLSCGRPAFIWALSIPTAIGLCLSYGSIVHMFSDASDGDTRGWAFGFMDSGIAFAGWAGAFFIGIIEAFSTFGSLSASTLLTMACLGVSFLARGTGRAGRLSPDIPA